MMRMIRAALRGALAVLSGACIASAAEIVAGRATVIDGDTIEIHGRRIRLFGIDAPEGAQVCLQEHGNEYRCGQKAALILQNRIGNGVVTCERKDTDRYGRLVASCRVYSEDLSAWMVGLGWAIALAGYTNQYQSAEKLAQRRKAGMWAGAFQRPSEWRAERDRSARP